jgi:hypothetical protein
MKKIITFIYLLFLSYVAYSQNGLKNIIVEKYYISDSADAMAVKGGQLPIGSVTYRVYAEMLPGYKFQAAYGVPGHELRIATSTLFFNNEDRGATISNAISKNQLKNNTVMLDSWLSVGAGSEDCFAVLKTDDDGLKTIVNTDVPQHLQNTDERAGIPLKIQDGLISMAYQSIVTLFGIDSAAAIFFGNKNDGRNGPVFSTSNGSWASFGGSIGHMPGTNKVLIAQITTDGKFSFELNIQIGTPSGGTQNFVARNPVGSEVQLPCLIYPSLTKEIDSSTKNKFRQNNKIKK